MLSMPIESRTRLGPIPAARSSSSSSAAGGWSRQVDDQRLRVADVGKMAEQLEQLDQPPSGLAAAADQVKMEPAPFGRYLRARSW